MKRILPFLFLPLFFHAQNPAFKKAMETGDGKFSIKSYKEAYKEYDAALAMITPDLDKLMSEKKQAAKDQADWVKCLSRHARCAYIISNLSQANTDAEKLSAIDSANADAKAIKAFALHKSGEKMIACRDLKRLGANDLSARVYEDCFCWAEGVNQFRDANSAFSLGKNAEALAFINNAI
jgi:hypothetical protein